MVHELLKEAENVFGKITPGMRLEIERIKASMVLGQRHTRKAGPGIDILGPNIFQHEIHDRKQIHPRLTMRSLHDHDIVMEREQESSRRFGLYVDTSDSMDYKSEEAAFTKKQAALIKALVLATDLGVQEDQVAVVSEGRFLRSGRRMMQAMAGSFKQHMAIMGAHSVPQIPQIFKNGDSVIWFSDFGNFAPADNDRPNEELASFANMLNKRGLHGFFVMVLDPSELSFDFKGHIEFRGKEGETDLSGEAGKVFDHAESIRTQYLQALRAHIQKVADLCKSKGIAFVLQPTNKPLEDAIHHLKTGQKDPLQHVAELGL